MKPVNVRRSADRDFDEIYDWIARDDEQAAERMVRRLVEVAGSLGEFPERAPERPEIGEGVRGLTVGRYLLLYRVGANSVDVVRVVHGARELSGLMDRPDEPTN